MDTIKELFDAIKGQLSERLANPFTGAFCIAWVIWNFRLLMVFMGKGTYQDKFLYIDTDLYPDWRYWAVRGVVGPMVTAVAYLWAYPRATRRLAEDYRRQQTTANNLMKAAEGTALLSLEDSVALRVRLAEAEQRWKTERDQLNKELDAQREMVADLLKRREELMQQREGLQKAVDGSTVMGGIGLTQQKTSAKTLGEIFQPPVSDKVQFRLAPRDAVSLPQDLSSESYTRPQLQILSVLREGNRLSTADLASRLKIPSFEIQRTLDRLLAVALIDTADESEWYITSAGRSVLGAFVDSNQWNFANEGL